MMRGGDLFFLYFLGFIEVLKEAEEQAVLDNCL